MTAPRSQLIEYGRRLLTRGLVTGTAGNLSMLDGDHVVITPSSFRYDLMTPEQVCLLDRQGQQVAGTGRPSSETPMHLAIYAATDARAIIHTHSPYVAAIASVIDELPAVHYAIHRFGGASIRVAPYARFGSGGLAESAITALSGRRAAILANHGAITHGSSLDDAYELAELLEWLATVYWRARLLGEPRILTESQLEEVAEAVRRYRYGVEE